MTLRQLLVIGALILVILSFIIVAKIPLIPIALGLVCIALIIPDQPLQK